MSDTNFEEILEQYSDNPEEGSAESSVESGTGEISEQPNQDSSQNDSQTSQDDSLESKLEGFELQKDDSEGGDLLSKINDLGLIRNGLPVEYSDIENVREALQQHKDYTFKTQELAEQKKQLEADFAKEQESFEEEKKEFYELRDQDSQVLVENQIMEQVIQDISRSDPDMFEELKRLYNQYSNNYQSMMSNPETVKMQKQLSEMQSYIKHNKDRTTMDEHKRIARGWEEGIKDVQTKYGPKLRSLGLKINWNEVQDVWSADNSGTMTPQQALFAKYGDRITQALEAAKKNSDLKNKSDLRRGPKNPGQKEPSIPMEKSEKTIDYLKRKWLNS